MFFDETSINKKSLKEAK